MNRLISTFLDDVLLLKRKNNNLSSKKSFLLCTNLLVLENLSHSFNWVFVTSAYIPWKLIPLIIESLSTIFHSHVSSFNCFLISCFCTLLHLSLSLYWESRCLTYSLITVIHVNWLLLSNLLFKLFRFDGIICLSWFFYGYKHTKKSEKIRIWVKINKSYQLFLLLSEFDIWPV